MSNATNGTGLKLATFNLTKEQVAWVNREAQRLAKSRPGSKPNRSEVARVAIEKAMRESEKGGTGSMTPRTPFVSMEEAS